MSEHRPILAGFDGGLNCAPQRLQGYPWGGPNWRPLGRLRGIRGHALIAPAQRLSGLSEGGVITGRRAGMAIRGVVL